ncbi:hypothetical protein BJ165DRAFT_1496361 [Panaeolus papilionaceus]|nr:hypothetical protein BJ165DRAFT_1496361 [Panaeolus papilionaceus]
MFAMGWHTSFEKGAEIATYAASRHQAAIEIYRDLYPKLPQVANAYRTRLMSLYPLALKEMTEAVQKDGIPNFSDAELSDDIFQGSYANALAITRDNFANFQHRDNDETPHTYGWWWPALLSMDGRYHVDWNSHSKTEGGGFSFGEYGIGVDFQRCNGCLVEIQWRGKTDIHGTAKSISEGNFTRFGTSIQITAKGAGAARRFWANGGNTSRSITYSQRAGT